MSELTIPTAKLWRRVSGGKIGFLLPLYTVSQQVEICVYVYVYILGWMRVCVCFGSRREFWFSLENNY